MEKTYKKEEKIEKDLIDDLKTVLKNIGFEPKEKDLKLATLYWTAKMHKTPVGARFIASSNVCITKKLSKTISKCLKLIQARLKRKDTWFRKRNGFSRFWVVESTEEVIDMVEKVDKANELDCFDFSTLYTMIDHVDLKATLKRVVEEAFGEGNEDEQFLKVTAGRVKWVKEKKDKGMFLDAEGLMCLINTLIDNIYISSEGVVYKQGIGIPMGTDCAPFLANLYLVGKVNGWMNK